MAANATQFKEEISKAASSLDGLENRFVKLVPGLDLLTNKFKFAATAIGASMLAFNAATVKVAMDLETPMRNVATVWDEAGQKAAGTFVSIGGATQQIIDLSAELTQSASVLAGALYNVASSGFQGSEAMDVLAASARAADAGLTDSVTSGRAITSVLNAYGLAADKATAVSDTMFQVVNKGVVSYEELAQNMGDIAPLASSAGVAFDDAGSALAAMTLTGLPAAEAATSLSGVLRGLVDPSKEMSMLLEGMGYESGVAALKALGLKGVLDQLRTATHNQSDAWIALFPDIRAARGAMAANAQDGRILADVYSSVTDKSQVAGSTQRALAEQSKSVGYQMQILHNTLNAVLARLGQALLPIVAKGLEIFNSFGAAINLLPGPVFTLFSRLTSLVGILGVLLGLWGTHYLKIKIFERAMDFLRVRADVLGEHLQNAMKFLQAKAETRGLENTAKAFQKIQTAAGGAGAGVKLLEGAMAALSYAQGVLVVITGFFSLMGAGIVQAKQRAEELRAEIEGKYDLTSMEGLIAAQEEIQENLDKANATLSDQGLAGWNVFKTAANSLAFVADVASPLPNTFLDAAGASNELTEASEKNALAQARLTNNVAIFADKTGMSEAAVLSLAKAEKIDLTGATQGVLEKLAEAAGGMDKTQIAATKLAGAFDEVTKAFTPATAWQAATAAANQQMQKLTDTARKGIRDRYVALDEGLRKEERAEKQALDDRVDQWEKALESEHDVFVEAIEARYRVLERALEQESRAEEQALDDRQRAEDEALDRQFRAEKEALDDRLRLIDLEADKRKKDEERRWEEEKDAVQFLIDSTFGAEREGWKARLIELEDQHDDRLNVIETENDNAKRTEKDSLDDRQQQEKNVNDDRQRAEKNSLDDRLNGLKQNLSDREEAEKNAEDVRYENAKTALDKEVTQLQTALDDKYARRKKNLEDQQKLEEDAADKRYISTDAKNKLAAEQYAKFLDDQLKKADEHNMNLAIIASRGGQDVLAEIAKLDPAVVAEIAKSGTAAFTAWLERIRQSLITGTRGPGLPTGLGGEPGHRTGVPGAADGGIFRFADGGRYAQIAPAGAWRVWAEPETGGEAYIPLALSKRTRSLSILGQVASRFGYGLTHMANGGSIGGGSGGSMFNMPISIEARVSAGVDPDAVGAAIAAHTKRAVDEALGAVSRRVLMRGGGA